MTITSIIRGTCAIERNICFEFSLDFATAVTAITDMMVPL